MPLPKQLAAIKRGLETRPLGSVESELLQELGDVEKLIDAGKTSDAANSRRIAEHMTKEAFANTSGPQGTCGCCGRRL